MTAGIMLEFRVAARRPMTSIINPEGAAMDRSDSRLLPVSVLNERRRRAVMLHLNGMTLDEVSRLCGVEQEYRDRRYEGLPRRRMGRAGTGTLWSSQGGKVACSTRDSKKPFAL